MVRKHALVLLGAMSVCIASGAAEVVEQQMPLPQGGKVNIRCASGTVKVETWDTPEVWVQARVDNANTPLEALRLTDDQTLQVRVTRLGGDKEVGANLLVRLPKEAIARVETLSGDVVVDRHQQQLEVSTTSGDITARFEGERLLLKSLSGDIEVTGVSQHTDLSSTSGDIKGSLNGGSLRAETVSGDITLETHLERAAFSATSGDIRQRGTVGQATANTISGDVSLQRVADSADVFTSSGRIEVGLSGARELHAESISGHIQAKGPIAENAVVELSSKSGRIDISLPHGTPARYNLRSFSGNVGAPGGTASRAVKGRELVLDPGGVLASVTAQSFSGDVRVTHESAE